MNLNKYLATVKPEFDPPIKAGDTVLFRRYGVISGWLRRPRLGIINTIHDDGLFFTVEYPSKKGFQLGVMSVFQIIYHYPEEQMRARVVYPEDEYEYEDELIDELMEMDEDNEWTGQ